ncbi:hypothetical protein [Cupriavidus metallidurans]|uniref:hypothetical protein n=1 Tax=Cupriavidus metallidurans TaxID=119219 RepID=UPI000A6519B4|nr:hypothetical protein [Cupriavidus metallidurans]
MNENSTVTNGKRLAHREQRLRRQVCPQIAEDLPKIRRLRQGVASIRYRGTDAGQGRYSRDSTSFRTAADCTPDAQVWIALPSTNQPCEHIARAFRSR